MSEMIAALSAVFITAGAMLLVANRFSLPTVPFYIIAGFIAGEFIPQVEILDLAQWGIAFLVFVFGVGIEGDKLSAVFRDSELTASAQLIVVGPIGFGAGILLGFDPLNALYFAAAATLSSTLVGTGLLEVEIRENLVHGRLAKSIHLVDDMLAIGLVLVLSATTFSGDAIAAKIGYGVVLVILALLIQRHLFALLIRYSEGSQELLMLGAISLLIGFLTLTEMMGIAPAVGAFAAGLAIRRDDIRTLGMRNGINSITDFFVVIFFVTLGALVSIPSTQVIVTAGALALLTALVNPIVTTVALLKEGYDARTATLTSASLDQVSEFALIIAIQALLMERIDPALFDAIILAAAVTMVTSSLTRRYDEQLFKAVIARIGWDRQTRKIDEQSSVLDSLSDHVVIVGYGRMGRRVAAVCERADVDYVVIENDPAMLPTLRERADQYILGDVMYDYVCQKAAVSEAQLVVSTIEQSAVSDRVLALETTAERVLRAENADEAAELQAAGATLVIVTDLLASERLYAIVSNLITGDLSPEELLERHHAELDAIDARGISSVWGGNTKQ